MKRNDILLSLSASALVLMLGLCSCVHDNDLDEPKRMIHIVPSLDARPNVEFTRASDDQRYGEYIEADVFPVKTKIGVTFFKPESATKTVTAHSGTFQYDGKNASPKWTSSVTVEPSTNYMVFGHVPYDASESFIYDYTPISRTVNGVTYDNLNKITLTNIKPVSDTDVSVVVGVGRDHFWKTGRTEENTATYKDASNNDVDFLSGAFPCNFSFLTSDGKESTQNTIYLLMDHLFVKSMFKFQIDEDYQKLRDIRIRQLKLAAPDVTKLNADIYLNVQPAITATNSVTDIKASEEAVKTAIVDIVWDMTVTTGADSNKSEAVVYDCTKIETPTGWTSTSGTAAEEATALAEEKAKGYLLTNESVLLAPGFFSPINASDTPMPFRITVLYDVYDKKGAKTREGSTAMNVYVSEEGVAIKRGTVYSLNITVKPTYLYQLSDNDLDNPTLVWN